MAVIDYFGAGGTILTTLDKYIPGLTLFILFITIFFGWLFWRAINKIEEQPMEAMQHAFPPMLALGVLSFILFANIAVVFILEGIMIAVFALGKHAWSKAEHLSKPAAALEKQHFPELERLRTETKTALGALESKIPKKEVAEREEVKEERIVEEILEKEDVLLAAEEDLAQDLQHIADAESAGEQKIEQATQAVEQYSDQLAQTVQQTESLEAADHAGKHQMVGIVQGIAQTCNFIVQTATEVNKERIKAIQRLLQDVNIIKELTKHAGMLVGATGQIDKTLEKTLGQSIIAQAQEVLDDKVKLLNSLARKIKTTKDNQALTDQLKVQQATINDQITKLQDGIKTLKGMKNQLSSTLNELSRTVATTRAKLKELAAAEKPAIKHETQITSFIEKFSQIIEKLQEAGKQFGQTVSQLNHEELAVPEEVPIKATTDIGAIFTQILALKKTAADFHTNSTLPFAQDLMTVIQKSQEIEPLMNALRTGFGQVQNGFTTLKATAATIMERTAEVSRDERLTLQKLQKGIDALAAQGEQERNRMAKQAIDNLGKSQATIKREIGQLEQAEKSATATEQHILGQFTHALTALTSHKATIDKNFQTQAQQFTILMGEAQQTVQQARKAA